MKRHSSPTFWNQKWLEGVNSTCQKDSILSDSLSHLIPSVKTLSLDKLQWPGVKYSASTLSLSVNTNFQE